MLLGILRPHDVCLSYITAKVRFCFLGVMTSAIRSSRYGACLPYTLEDTDLMASGKTTWLLFPVYIENNGAFIVVTACQKTAHTPTGDLCWQPLATETVPNTIIKTVANVN